MVWARGTATLADVRWIAMSLALTMTMTACVSSSSPPGVTTASSFGVTSNASADTSNPPSSCPEGDGVTAEFWFSGVPTVEPELCTVTGIRLAMDDLDIELDLDCEGSVMDGTGPSQEARTIKLGPSMTRPALTLGDTVEVSTTSQMQACDANERIALWRDDGVLLAAGFTPYEALVSVTADEGLEFSAELELNDDGCLQLNATLGSQSVTLSERTTTTLTDGGHTYRIDVGDLRGPEPVGDDCGGNATRFDALVVLEP